MNKHGVNFTVFPDGRRLVRNDDDATAKAEALRLGLLPGMMAGLRQHNGTHGVAGLARDGDRLVAVFAWAGFKSDTDNGWASMSVTPACEETADWLLNLTRQVIDANSIQFIEGFSSWRN